MAVKWSKVAPYIEEGFASNARVERTSIVDKAFDDGADDDIVDTIDAIGSRTPEPSTTKQGRIRSLR